MLVSLDGEIMENVKTEREIASVSAAELVRRLAEETTAFEIVNAVEEKAKCADQRKVEWDQVISLSVKPDQRQVDLLVQTRQHLLPNTVLGLLQKLKGDRPEGAILLCAPYISPRVAEMCREQNVSYLDGVGNCWIAAPGLFVRTEVKLLQGWSVPLTSSRSLQQPGGIRRWCDMTRAWSASTENWKRAAS